MPRRVSAGLVDSKVIFLKKLDDVRALKIIP
jgi:hypothetical protein